MKRNEMETLLLLWFLISNRSKRTKNRFLLWNNFGEEEKKHFNACSQMFVRGRRVSGACVFTCISLEAPSLCTNKQAYRCGVRMYTCAYMPVHDTIDKSEIFVDHLLCGTLFTSEIEAVASLCISGHTPKEQESIKNNKNPCYAHTYTTHTHILHCPVKRILASNQFIISWIPFCFNFEFFVRRFVLNLSHFRFVSYN